MEKKITKPEEIISSNFLSFTGNIWYYPEQQIPIVTAYFDTVDPYVVKTELLLAEGCNGNKTLLSTIIK